jgi:hypothetical protein
MQNHRKALILAILSLFVVDFLGTPARAADPVRVTTSFDSKYAGGVLRQVAKIFSAGFSQSDAARVEQEINGLKPDQPRAWQFKVQYRGKAESLEIRALMDDLGMIDLDFSASPEAAPAVRSAVDGYLSGRGA